MSSPTHPSLASGMGDPSQMFPTRVLQVSSEMPLLRSRNSPSRGWDGFLLQRSWRRSDITIPRLRSKRRSSWYAHVYRDLLLLSYSWVLDCVTTQDMDLIHGRRHLICAGRLFRTDSTFERKGMYELFVLLFDNYRTYEAFSSFPRAKHIALQL